MTRYAFYFDASSCSGCKACQAACKDKHQLAPGLLWRRVYEVSGGDWLWDGGAWVSNVFAYNVSLACCHCERPICQEVCPAKAITQRADGIVLIDPGRCLGCKYCSWACPYGAPQYDLHAGRMTKCTLCFDEIDQGRSPACAAACPLRVLDFGDLDELVERHGGLSEIFPLPEAALTQPALVITPHQAARRARSEGARVANWEEVRPR
jgi:anaerobic dimethyl sulfoxide reductase subunit B (iron-sulfur subunit)